MISIFSIVLYIHKNILLFQQTELHLHNDSLSSSPPYKQNSAVSRALRSVQQLQQKQIEDAQSSSSLDSTPGSPLKLQGDV